MKSINILACSNGVGISRDVEIIESILKPQGYDVDVNHTYKSRLKRHYDLNIHLERFNPATFGMAHKNIMIPNQEWFEKAWLPVRNAFDVYFTKSRFADAIFSSIGCQTEFVGFTSADRYKPDIKKDSNHWIHVAGKSIQKQTDTIIRVWSKNPGFPHLTIVQDPKFWKPRPLLKNVTFMMDRVPFSVLDTMQNCYSVHVCTSSTEGFGHYIMEAMSMKGLVITTDGPPMNELVTEDRGILVKSSSQSSMHMSTKYLIDDRSLEEAVIKTMIMDDGMKSEKVSAARSFFLENDKLFRERFLNAIDKVLN